MEFELHDGPASRPLIADLSTAVYPPEVLSTIIWRDVTSARASRRVVIRDGDEVVAAAGWLWRQASLDACPVMIAGVGGVMTLPNRQGQGLGRLAVQAAMAEFKSGPEAQFALLFCEEKNVGFYTRLGWSRFSGKVIVDQPTGPVVYNLMQTMVVGVAGSAPSAGEIDLNGLPW